MFRPKVSTCLLVFMLAAVAAMSACSTPNAQEENLVRQYFRASGLRDNQTLANFAVVSFDPKVEGVVTDFEITSVSPERSEPMKILDLSKAVSEAESVNKEFNERKKVYQDANRETIDRVLQAQKERRKLTGKDGQIQVEWEKWQADTVAEAKKLSSPRIALTESRPIAEMSLAAANGDPPPLEQLNGNIVSKDITVAAQVRGVDGATSQKNYVLTMQRAVVKNEKGERNGKWIIVGVKPA